MGKTEIIDARRKDWTFADSFRISALVWIFILVFSNASMNSLSYTPNHFPLQIQSKYHQSSLEHKFLEILIPPSGETLAQLLENYYLLLFIAQTHSHLHSLLSSPTKAPTTRCKFPPLHVGGTRVRGRALRISVYLPTHRCLVK